MLLVGAVGWREAAASVNLHVLAVLLGMMTLVAALDAANAFEVAAAWVARRARSATGLLVATGGLTAVLSALVLNDAVVLLLTPVLVRACREMGLPAMPYLAVEAVAANVGSVATPVGNPQNVLVALESGIGFARWASVLVVPTLASLALALLWARLFFRRDLATVPRERARLQARLANPALARVALGGVALALVGFVLGPRVGVGLDVAALGAGLAVVVAAPLVRADPRAVFRRVDAGVLVFFAGLFVLVAGVQASGLLDLLHRALAPLGFGTAAGLTAVTAVLSNLVSNVPAVVLLLPAVAGEERLLLLAGASTLAGNATLLGAAANVIVAESARARGETFDVGRFVLYGLPLTLATLALAAWLVPRLA